MATWIRHAGISGVAALALGTATHAVQAQDKEAAQPVEEVVVTGIRASLQSAQQIKQNAEQIVDSIVAEDIGKLPDNNVAEALQRISGIQIDRNYGEGSSIAIRGLTQVRTEVNGRDVFTANNGRALSFEDVPAELLAGIDVYKNPSADIIEGGLGGTVNLRTRMPFDSTDRTLSASVRANRFDLIDKTEFSYSGLFSDRWDTGIGEIGALVNLAYQDGGFRQDTISTEPFLEQTNIPGFIGQVVNVPGGGGINTTFGDRRRIGTTVALQWRPSDDMQFYLQSIRADYRFKWRDFTFFSYSGGGPMTPDPNGAFSVGPGGDLISGSFVDVPSDSNMSILTRDSVTTDYSVGGKWNFSDALTLSTDFQYIEAETDALRYIVGLHSQADSFRQDLSTSNPTMAVNPAGFITDPTNFQWNFALDNIDANEGDEKAWRTDAEYLTGHSVFESFKVGVRLADRTALNTSTGYRYTYLGQPLSNFPNAPLTVNPFSDFFRGDANAFGAFFAPSEDLVADYPGSLQDFGITDPLLFQDFNRNEQSEETYATYGVLRFDTNAGKLPIDGNIGVRLVKSEVNSRGVMTNPETVGQPNQAPLPVSIDQSYTSTLPSLNVRAHLSDQLQWRVALSKGISRAPFDKLSPNLSLNATADGTGTRRTGSAGNPNLKPLEANQADTSLEWYYQDGGMVYGALFYKEVDGFIANVVQNETYGGVTWEVTRPLNGEDGKIKGIEVGFQGFADFLPGAFSGLGWLVNYTYVDSEAPSPDASDTSGRTLLVPLEGLSKNSYNVIGIYERGKIAARVAYNWRSSWVRTTRGNGTQNLPIYDEGFGQLDASLAYDVTDSITVALDGVNLTDTKRTTIFGLETRPRDSILSDRRIGLSFRVDL